MLRSIRLVSILMMVAAMLQGCVHGVLYTKITEPLTLNMQDAKRGKNPALGYSDQLSEPFTGVGLRVEWASRGIGDIALNNNLNTVSYADVETLSIFFGLYRRKTVKVYGEPKNLPAE